MNVQAPKLQIMCMMFNEGEKLRKRRTTIHNNSLFPEIHRTSPLMPL